MASAPTPTPAASSGMTNNVAAALSYITIVGIIFLLIEPYNKIRFVRFHAFQSIFFAVAITILWFPMWILAIVLHFIPLLGPILGIILFPAYGFAIFLAWLFLVYKAYSNEEFKFPFIGNLAAKQVAGM